MLSSIAQIIELIESLRQTVVDSIASANAQADASQTELAALRAKFEGDLANLSAIADSINDRLTALEAKVS